MNDADVRRSRRLRLLSGLSDLDCALRPITALRSPTGLVI